MRFFAATGAVMQSDSLETDGLTLIVCICTVCQYIHPLYRRKCPLSDNQSNEKVKAVFILKVAFVAFQYRINK